MPNGVPVGCRQKKHSNCVMIRDFVSHFVVKERAVLKIVTKRPKFPLLNLLYIPGT